MNKSTQEFTIFFGASSQRSQRRGKIPQENTSALRIANLLCNMHQIYCQQRL